MVQAKENRTASSYFLYDAVSRLTFLPTLIRSLPSLKMSNMHVNFSYYTESIYLGICFACRKRQDPSSLLVLWTLNPSIRIRPQPMHKGQNPSANPNCSLILASRICTLPSQLRTLQEKHAQLQLQAKRPFGSSMHFIIIRNWH